MIRSKILDMGDCLNPYFKKVIEKFRGDCGPGCFEVRCRQWEYPAAIVFSGIIFDDTNPSVLDAGCGNSVFPKFLARLNCEVTAIDPKISTRYENNIAYVQASMLDTGLEDNSFDYVFAMSSIEHVNAGNFAIPGMAFDTGDTEAMLELKRVLKPDGIMVITTDFANEYYPPPGLWPSGSHRIYDKTSIFSRLIDPAGMKLYEESAISLNHIQSLSDIEPLGYEYTEAIFTLKNGGN